MHASILSPGGEDFREARAWHVRRDDRQPVTVIQMVDGAGLREPRVAEGRQPVEAAAQPCFEIRYECEVRPDAQEFERTCRLVVEHQQPIAEPVGKPLRVPARKRGVPRWSSAAESGRAAGMSRLLRMNSRIPAPA